MNLHTPHYSHILIAQAGVRLAAALAVQGLFDTTDTSPRADMAPTWGSKPTEEEANGDACTDPLARLAASALLPVLHLSLHVQEVQSRWRMAQLLCRLVGRLATAQPLLQPMLPALSVRTTERTRAFATPSYPQTRERTRAFATTADHPLPCTPPSCSQGPPLACTPPSCSQDAVLELLV